VGGACQLTSRDRSTKTRRPARRSQRRRRDLRRRTPARAPIRPVGGERRSRPTSALPMSLSPAFCPAARPRRFREGAQPNDGESSARDRNARVVSPATSPDHFLACRRRISDSAKINRKEPLFDGSRKGPYAVVFKSRHRNPSRLVQPARGGARSNPFRISSVKSSSLGRDSTTIWTRVPATMVFRRPLRVLRRGFRVVLGGSSRAAKRHLLNIFQSCRRRRRNSNTKKLGFTL